MQSMPLFPLHTVLFPRMPLPLHIFEERYKEMIAKCISDERPFGVLLIDEGVEVGGLAIPRNVGTIANIRVIEPLDDSGRMNILAEGSQRFRLVERTVDPDTYLMGVVEILKDDPTNKEELTKSITKITSQFREYFEILVTNTGISMPNYELPTDPEDLSFVVAAVLEGDVEFRQSLLEMTSTASRLAIESERLEAELEIIREIKYSKPQEVITRITSGMRRSLNSNN